MKENKRIILLLHENPPSAIGGIERHSYNILQLFKDDRNIEIKVLSKNEITHSRISKIDKILFSFKELKQKIISSGAEIVHIHGFASFVVFQAIIAAAITKKKIIYTPHFHPFKTLDNPALGKFFFYLLLRPILNKVNTIICINEEDTLFFKRYHSNIITIPNWLNDTPSPDDIIHHKKSQNNKMILFVGRADNNKGVDHLQKLSTEKYEIHCVTKGHIKDGFIYHQGISEKTLSDLYYQAKLVVIPSRYEAFSYVALESLSHGTQVLVSERVRIIDHLSESNSLLHHFNYGDFDAFLKEIDVIMNKDTNEQLSNSFYEIVTTFDKEKIKEVLKSIYLQG